MLVEEKPTPQEEMAEPTGPGTTSKLFDAPVVEAEGTPAPIPTVAPEPAKVETPKEKAAPVPDPQTPESLDLQAFGDRMVKVKIDGQEMEVPFREVVKGYQTDQYLSRKGQRIEGERQRLKETRIAPAPYVSQETQPAPPDDPLYEVVKPYLEPLQRQLAQAEVTIGTLSNLAAPVQYQQNLKGLDGELKKQGFTDFNDYVPKIEAELSGMSEEGQKLYDTRQGFETLYLRMKMQEKTKTINPDARPQPKLLPINQVESGSPPSNIDDSSSQDKKLFEQATASGDIRDWAKLFAFRSS